MIRSNLSAYFVRAGWFILLVLGLALTGCRRETPPQPAPVQVVLVALVDSVQAEVDATEVDLDLQRLQAEFGARVQVQAIRAANAQEAGRRLDEWLAAGRARLVIATSAGLDDVLRRAAAGADGVQFEQRAGYRRLPNLRNFDLRRYEAAYLAGVQAGVTTELRSVEVTLAQGVAATPERLCEINAFGLGVRRVDPSIKVRLVAEGEAEQPGSDLRLRLTPQGLMLMRWPATTEVGRSALSWWPYYRRAVQDVLDGSWNNQSAWWGIRDGSVDWSVAADVDAAARERVQQERAVLRDGKQPLWRGPLRDQSGQLVLRDGETADDRFLHGMHVLIQGIEGALPAMR